MEAALRHHNLRWSVYRRANRRLRSADKIYNQRNDENGAKNSTADIHVTLPVFLRPIGLIDDTEHAGRAEVRFSLTPSKTAPCLRGSRH